MSNLRALRLAESALSYWAEVSGRRNFTDRNQMNEPTREALREVRAALGQDIEPSAAEGSVKP